MRSVKSTYEIRQNQALKKVTVSILFEKVCLVWKPPIINRLGVWNKNVLDGKNRKTN